MIVIFSKLQSELELFKEYTSLTFKHNLNPTIVNIGINQVKYTKPKVVGLDLLCDNFSFFIRKQDIGINKVVLEISLVA